MTGILVGGDPRPLVDWTEGAARLRVPQPRSMRGPGTVDGELFFNPAMAPSRDLAMVVPALWFALHPRRGSEPLRAIDPMAGSGVRAIRWAAELGLEVVANDIDSSARTATIANLALTSAHLAASNPQVAAALEQRVAVHDRPAHLLLAQERAHLIDIDPFGSPIHLVAAATGALAYRGLLALTATDTPVLCGAMPEPAMARYGAVPLRCPITKELGLRILVGAAVRIAANQGRALRPVLCHVSDHHMRAYLGCAGGSTTHFLQESVRQLGWVRYDRTVGVGTFVDAPQPGWNAQGPRTATIRSQQNLPADVGPLWTGPLFDPELIATWASTASAWDIPSVSQPCTGILPSASAPLARLQAALIDESPADLLPMDLPTQGRLLRCSLPRKTELIARLQLLGARASGTHIDGQGIRTDAPIATVQGLLSPR